MTLSNFRGDEAFLATGGCCCGAGGRAAVCQVFWMFGEVVGCARPRGVPLLLQDEQLLAGTKGVLVGVTVGVPSCYENRGESWLRFFILW